MFIQKKRKLLKLLPSFTAQFLTIVKFYFNLVNSRVSSRKIGKIVQAILINLFVDTYIRLNYNETECNTFITIKRYTL